MQRVLDADCGARMFYFDKQNPDVLFMDIRNEEHVIGSYETKDGVKERKLVVSPDVVADFTNMPFSDNSFYMVVFDPPHLLHAGESSWLDKKYGVLNKDTWKEDLSKGFEECMRVLKPNGTLVFKWNTEQIDMNKVLSLFSKKPIFGDKRSKTRWIVFMK